jgi:hypothetical protein
MHSLTDLAYLSAKFALDRLKETTDRLIASGSGSTAVVKALQMVRLQKAIMSVGMFSMFESILQQRMGWPDGFGGARKFLAQHGDAKLAKRFELFAAAVNVLKHGEGKSYDMLLSEAGPLPFRVKPRGDYFFHEGDVSEVTVLVDADDAFVMACAELIIHVSTLIRKANPACGL